MNRFSRPWLDDPDSDWQRHIDAALEDKMDIEREDGCQHRLVVDGKCRFCGQLVPPITQPKG
jgi:hypothetical protein